MAESTDTRLYEGLFLINPQAMGGDLQSAVDHVREMLDRAEAEVLSLRKWDERKLAYTIQGQKRGVYMLSLFRVNPRQIANIERDCNLSEQVLRVLMTHAEHLGETEIETEQNSEHTTQAEVEMDSASEATDGGQGENVHERAETASTAESDES